MADIDLNLLRIFDALMELRSVTRAARHVGVTQSAISHALARLRRTLDDPLFVRGPAGLQPTARAEEMSLEVRQGLFHLQRAVTRLSFDPGSNERRFVIASGAYFCALLVPVLVARIRMVAPGISLRVVPVTEDLASLLDHGSIDIALGSLLPAPSRFMVEPLQEEELVWIAAAANPVAQAPIDTAVVMTLPRVNLIAQRPFEIDASSAGDPAGVTGRHGWEAVMSADEAITVYDAQTAAAIVARTDLVALVPSKIARHANRLHDLRVLDVSGEGYRFGLSMTWHARYRSDAGLEWLRQQIREAVREIDRVG